MSSAGVEAVQLLETAHRPPDPWQRDALHDLLGEQDTGLWSAGEVGLVVPRQNGKGDVLMGKALHSLYLTPVKLILWSAHEFKSVREMFIRTRETVEGCHELSRRVKTIRTSHGEEGIELKDGSRLSFVARSRGSGRGFSPEELLLDEAFALTDEQVAAQLFATSAQPNVQIWYASSHPLANSVVLRRIVRRGRAGSPGLAYIEYSSDPALDRDDPEGWQQANPNHPARLTIAAIQRERGSTDPDDFDRERRGIVDLEDDEAQVFDGTRWTDSQDLKSQVKGDRVALSVDMTPDRTETTLGIAGFRSDGLRHGEVVDMLSGSKRAVKRVRELVKDWDVCVVVIDANSPAVSLVPDLAKAGWYDSTGRELPKDERWGIVSEPREGSKDVRLELVGGTKMSGACGAWVDAVEDDQLRFIDQTELNTALAGAKKRPTMDGGWKWSRKDSSVNIGPLVVVTLADYGLNLYGEPDDELPEPWIEFG